ncbi:hypothetical protein N473_22125 [Pseudoalteromonas luteoviolacea CPMOR-1]|uniref:Uncharacterized protein n=1 Tax=Pseudoalteromonas luteoviolacea CPMOR-1 TaxID=1365248 RepID=A0A162BGM9_9GAMM|nr:hypothetical protein [Pseudoalteromonas luteoviolacea]KZN61807.1 hypothetical protein N473_22125 [Pseudoalteromonas luteoviolacea CPMOR-1]
MLKLKCANIALFSLISFSCLGFSSQKPRLSDNELAFHVKGVKDKLSWTKVEGATEYSVMAYSGDTIYQARYGQGPGTGFSQSSDLFIPQYKTYTNSIEITNPHSNVRYLVVPCNRFGCSDGMIADRIPASIYLHTVEEFSYSKGAVYPWESSRIRWKSSGAHTVNLLKNGRVYLTNLPPNGSVPVRINENTKFTIQSMGVGSVQTRSSTLIYKHAKIEDPVNDSGFLMPLRNMGIDIIPRTLVRGNERYLFVADKSSNLHKIDYSKPTPELVWSLPLGGKLVNKPLVEQSNMYFGISKMDGSGEVCSLHVGYSTRKSCKTTTDAVIAGAVAMDLYQGTRKVDTSIIFVSHKGRVLQYALNLVELRKTSNLPATMLGKPIIATPAINRRSGRVYFQYQDTHSQVTKLTAIRFSNSSSGGGAEPINPGGPGGNPGGNPGGPITGPIDPPSLFSVTVPLRALSKMELAQLNEESAKNNNMFEVEWTATVLDVAEQSGDQHE